MLKTWQEATPDTPTGLECKTSYQASISDLLTLQDNSNRKRTEGPADQDEQGPNTSAEAEVRTDYKDTGNQGPSLPSTLKYACPRTLLSGSRLLCEYLTMEVWGSGGFHSWLVS